MSKIETIINDLKTNWNLENSPLHRSDKNPFLLACLFEEEKYSGTTISSFTIPLEILEFWELSNGAKLFMDTEYGQWGLEILSSENSLKESIIQLNDRPVDIKSTDLIIGKFLGDSDLLIVSCDINSNKYGKIIVALPIDERNEWPIVADNFIDFLTMYSKNEGDKYWER